jgi:hypothetical protein
LPFPVNGVLDDFNRANNASLGASYAAVAEVAGRCQILSNKAQGPGGSTYGGDAWTTAFGTDFEVYGLFDGDSTQRWYLIAFIDPADATADGFALGARTDRLSMERITAGGSTGLQTWSVTVADGDQVGFSRVGTTFTVYLNGVAQSPTVTDANHAVNLKIGFELFTGYAIDNFGGGTLSAAATADPFPYVGAGYYPTQG